MSSHSEDIGIMIKDLQEKKGRLDSGEKLCRHKKVFFNGKYNCYCSLCDKGYLFDIEFFDIPIAVDAVCRYCK